jgi:hypothetical protein
MDFSNDFIVIMEKLIQIIVDTSCSGIFNWEYCECVFVDTFPYICKCRKTDNIFFWDIELLSDLESGNMTICSGDSLIGEIHWRRGQ